MFVGGRQRGESSSLRGPNRTPEGLWVPAAFRRPCFRQAREPEPESLRDILHFITVKCVLKLSS